MKIRREATDKWFSAWVRRDGRCAACRREYGVAFLQCAHIYSRRHRATRWMDQNALPLCFICHQRFGENPLDFHDWLEGYLDPWTREALRKVHQELRKVTPWEKKLVSQYWQQMVTAYHSEEMLPPCPPEIRQLVWLEGKQHGSSPQTV